VAADGAAAAALAVAPPAACPRAVLDRLSPAATRVEVATPERRLPVPTPAHIALDFSEAQAPAVDAMRAAADAPSFSVTLLDGVTGSGKTEVYFEAVARALERGRRALMMLPEIALTSQFVDRFQARFGCPPVEWHSALAAVVRARG